MRCTSTARSLAGDGMRRADDVPARQASLCTPPGPPAGGRLARHKARQGRRLEAIESRSAKKTRMSEPGDRRRHLERSRGLPLAACTRFERRGRPHATVGGLARSEHYCQEPRPWKHGRKDKKSTATPDAKPLFSFWPPRHRRQSSTALSHGEAGPVTATALSDDARTPLEAPPPIPAASPRRSVCPWCRSPPRVCSPGTPARAKGLEIPDWVCRQPSRSQGRPARVMVMVTRWIRFTHFKFSPTSSTTREQVPGKGVWATGSTTSVAVWVWASAPSGPLSQPARCRRGSKEALVGCLSAQI